MNELLVSAGVLFFSVLLATFVEGIIEILLGKALGIILRKYPAEDVARQWANYGLTVAGILGGVAIVWTTNLDLFGFAANLFGFEMMPAVSQTLTGVVVGRGSNYVHDIWKRIAVKE